MKKVAKLVISDMKDNYLILYRSNHPTFGNDPDLPGGTVEDNEDDYDAMIREVYEEIGVSIDVSQKVESIYSGTDYSAHGTHYTLYFTKLDKRPSITLSWEHTSYNWIKASEFYKELHQAKDSFMHMAYDSLINIHE